MKLAISNIAWNYAEDGGISTLLKKYNVDGIEIAPTKVWNPPVGQPDHLVIQYKQYWESHQIKLAAMQSLLFNKPDLTLFENDSKRNDKLLFLEQIMELASKLDIHALVYGSPRNRRKGEMSKEESFAISIPFFRKIGEIALEKNMVFCIEPNPVQYNCDFITTTLEGIELVKEVDHPGFRLHMDTGTLILNEEPVEETIEAAFPYLAHFHISQPYLGQVGTDYLEMHSRIAKCLKALEYKHWISIEMKNGLRDNNADAVEEALVLASTLYKE